VLNSWADIAADVGCRGLQRSERIQLPLSTFVGSNSLRKQPVTLARQIASYVRAEHLAIAVITVITAITTPRIALQVGR
jgi:hypothetical protein